MKIENENGVVKLIPETQHEFEQLRLIQERGISRMTMSSGWDSSLQELHIKVKNEDDWN